MTPLWQIRQSKTDQGRRRQEAIPHGTKLLPVQAVQAWMQAASIHAGAVFL